MDAEVRNTLQYESVEQPSQQMLASLFSARPVHLNGSKEMDYLVMGVGDLLGANVTPFWVLQQTANGYKVILRFAALSVEITEGVGYPEITAYASTAVQLHTMKFHFRGGVYRLRVDKWEDIK